METQTDRAQRLIRERGGQLLLTASGPTIRYPVKSSGQFASIRITERTLLTLLRRGLTPNTVSW